MRIHETAKIGKGTKIEDTAVIQENCEIGENCFIGHYVVMRPNTKIGNDTVIGHLTVFEGDCSCLLYTSDAADDLLCVDLGGRRFI